ncbi:MAG: hypothetical protein JOY80_04290 [Candidatus Dormibacteraeota bacterium]|nr:hypothetical protein [Candidatus Dormibacteraeota bacterium]
MAILYRPRSALNRLAASPRLSVGFAYVVVSGVVSAAIGIATASLEGSGASGLLSSLLVLPLFVAYWLVQGWLIDAGAGMIGRAGRRREFFAVSGPVFLPWIVYALLSLAEAAATHGGGAGPSVASGLAWLTVPVLAWFLTLTILAIRAVYDAPMLNAFALTLLPYAVVSAALLVLGAFAGVLRG